MQDWGQISEGEEIRNTDPGATFETLTWKKQVSCQTTVALSEHTGT